MAVRKLSDLKSKSSNSGASFPSLDMHLLESSSSNATSSMKSLFFKKKKLAGRLLKYSRLLVRVVRRQVLFNNYKSEMLKQYNLFKFVKLTKLKSTMSKEKKPHYLKDNSLLMIALDEKILNRLNETGVLDAIDSVKNI